MLSSPRRASLFFSVLALPACGATEPPVRPLADVPSAGPSASAAAPATSTPVARSTEPESPKDPCARLLAHNRALLAKVGGPNGPDHEGNDEEQKLANACFATPRGAWGIRLDRWENKDPPDSGDRDFTFEGAISVVHLPELVAAKDGPASLFALRGGFEATTLRRPMLFDYDGDGEPELFLVSDHHVHEDASTTHAALFTWKAGAVTVYPGLPPNVTASEDVDRDGRPDFLYFPYSEIRESACSGFGFRWDGPRFVAHALPGGAFSLDDKVAVDLVLRGCPAPPKGKIPAARGEACTWCPRQDCNLCPGAATPFEVCARVHGASEKEARGVLQRTCQKPRTPADECTPPAGVCGDYAEREKVLAKVQPVTRAAAPSAGAAKKP